MSPHIRLVSLQQRLPHLCVHRINFSTTNKGEANAPALNVSLLSSRVFIPSHACTFSQSSLPQQQKKSAGGSGDATRETFSRAWVRSSMVVVASYRLSRFVSGESGVGGRCDV
jgi:hypothetical protein